MTGVMVSAGLELASARFVDARHRSGERCADCRPNGCRLYWWAIRRIIGHQMAATARLILAEHWPVDGACGICKTPKCLAWSTACSYLGHAGARFPAVGRRPIPMVSGWTAITVAAWAADREALTDAEGARR